MHKFVAALLASTLVQGAASAAANDTPRIVDEGMNRSQVMVTASELMDGIGPRLTNSPNMRRAEQWAIAKFQSYGLSNVHREGFDFGRGWEIVRVAGRGGLCRQLRQGQRCPAGGPGLPRDERGAR